MKLLRFGEKGAERPGLLDNDGRVRDLTGHVDDIGGGTLTANSLGKLAALDALSPPSSSTPSASARAWRAWENSSASA